MKEFKEKLEQVAQSLGYDDVAQLEDNVDNYGGDLGEWWEVIKDLVSEKVKVNQELLEALQKLSDRILQDKHYDGHALGVNDDIIKRSIEADKDLQQAQKAINKALGE